MSDRLTGRAYDQAYALLQQLRICRDTLNAAEVAAGVYGTSATLIDYIEGAQVQAEQLDAERARCAALREALAKLPRYNCDCLPNGPDGQMASDEVAATDDAVHCERWVVLAGDLEAALAQAQPDGTPGGGHE